jgi:hypothetical protein
MVKNMHKGGMTTRFKKIITYQVLRCVNVERVIVKIGNKIKALRQQRLVLQAKLPGGGYQGALITGFPSRVVKDLQ